MEQEERGPSAEDVRRLKGRGFLRNKGTDRFSARVITVNGRITAAQQRCLADAAETYGDGMVSFTSRMTVEIPGIPFGKIEAFCAAIAKEGLETGGTGPRVRPVVSCKGTLCHFGRIDTFALSAEIHRRFYLGFRDAALPHKFKIAVGGCPNNCVKPDLNDLGVIGQLAPRVDAGKCRGCKSCAVARACPAGAASLSGGRLSIDPAACRRCGRCVGKCPFGAVPDGKTGYKVVIGGRWGKETARARPLGTFFTDPEDVLATIGKAILFYRENGLPGERFAQTIERIGFDRVEKALKL